ncbi:MAG: hypothetical protein KJ749_10705 [Planctomycetes bacterium]|nr:hypothetical protein [Planctomycetota bacterium]
MKSALRILRLGWDGRGRFTVVCAALAVQALPTVAWAQKPGRVVDDEESLLRYGIAAGVVVVMGITAFLNSKRSHLS